MPRSGVNGTYTLPGAQNGATPLQPISSAVNNQGWNDVAQTFNSVQPISYGGTGSSDLKLDASEFGIKDGFDPTKRVGFNVSAVTTGTTRTITVPNASGNLVLSPASTDNAIARYDQTSGQLQNSTILIGDNGNISPTVNDGARLGEPAISFADLFLAAGGVIGFNNFDVAITHSTDALSFTGASNGFSFDNNVSVGIYSVTGATSGMLLVPNSTGESSIRTSSTKTAISNHALYANPNGIVGSITTTGSATAYNVSSDALLKENKRSFDSGKIIDGISTWLFDWKAGGTGYGVMAQDAYQVFPDAVTKGDDPKKYGTPDYRPWGVDYSKFVPVLLHEVQEMRKRLKDAGIE